MAPPTEDGNYPDQRLINDRAQRIECTANRWRGTTPSWDELDDVDWWMSEIRRECSPLEEPE